MDIEQDKVTQPTSKDLQDINKSDNSDGESIDDDDDEVTQPTSKDL